MKAMVALIIALLIIVGLRLFWPSNEYEMRDVSQNEGINLSEVAMEQSDVSLPKMNIPSDDEKTKLMTAEYEILALERKKLKRHLAHLKHDMWGLKFSKEKAKKMSMSVMGASRLLNNPHMLGAFLNVEGIKDEIAKIKFAEKSLEQVSQVIKESKNTSKESS